MSTIAHIVASPRGANSKSRALSEAYIKGITAHDNSIHVDTIELWKEELPEFDADKAKAKMTFFGEGAMDDTQKTAWDHVVEITQRFKEADTYVFAIPMWNGGIPYKLKQYIDIITQPGLLFGFDPEKGYFGLLEQKKAVVFYTSGVYAPGAPSKYGQDYHSNYFKWWLNMIGIQEIEEVRFQPSLLTEDAEKDFQKVKKEVDQLIEKR